MRIDSHELDELARKLTVASVRAPIKAANAVKTEGMRVEADIAPVKTTGGLANIAFFGGAHGGGGTHRFYEHGEQEFETTARYVEEAGTSL